MSEAYRIKLKNGTVYKMFNDGSQQAATPVEVYQFYDRRKYGLPAPAGRPPCADCEKDWCGSACGRDQITPEQALNIAQSKIAELQRELDSARARIQVYVGANGKTPPIGYLDDETAAAFMRGASGDCIMRMVTSGGGTYNTPVYLHPQRDKAT